MEPKKWTRLQRQAKTAMMKRWLKWKRGGAYLDWSEYVRGRTLACYFIKEMEL